MTITLLDTIENGKRRQGSKHGFAIVRHLPDGDAIVRRYSRSGSSSAIYLYHADGGITFMHHEKKGAKRT